MLDRVRISTGESTCAASAAVHLVATVTKVLLLTAVRLRIVNQGPDLQNRPILRRSYDYLTIMPKSKVTIDLR